MLLVNVVFKAAAFKVTPFSPITLLSIIQFGLDNDNEAITLSSTILLEPTVIEPSTVFPETYESSAAVNEHPPVKTLSV